MKKVYYWSPFLTNVATISAVINSAIGLKKYSKEYKPVIINACGEFEKYRNLITERNIEIINLSKIKYFSALPKRGFLSSRVSYLLIFIFSFFPLLRLLKKNQPDYFILHLITSLPLLISKILKINTKFILRISGLPRYNFLRIFFWNFLGKNLYSITCPTSKTKYDLIEKKIFDENKIEILRDPVITISKLSRKNITKNFFDSKNFNIICVGRLTRQKNFGLILDNFNEILRIKNNSKLYIFGDGEEKNKLEEIIIKKNLQDKVHLQGFKEEIYTYFKQGDLFILSSLWEDPGWVLIEAAANNILILSSDCKNGPKEFLGDNRGGILFESNSSKSLLKSFKIIVTLSESEIIQKKIFAKQKIKDYSIFNHYLNLSKILFNKKNTL